MKLIENLKITLPLVICLYYSSAHAQVLSDTLPFEAEPQESWIAILDKGSLRIVKADLVKTPEKLHLSAYVTNSAEIAAIAGVVKYVDGQMFSNPLHPAGKLEISKESSKIAQDRLLAIVHEIKNLEVKKQSLKQEVQKLTKSLRHEAGLDDVDKIYEKVEKLEERLKELEAANSLGEQ